MSCLDMTMVIFQGALLLYISIVYFVLALVNCWAIIHVAEMQPFHCKTACMEYIRIMSMTLYVALAFPKHLLYFLWMFLPHIPIWSITKTVFSLAIQIPLEMVMLCCCSKRHQ